MDHAFDDELLALAKNMAERSQHYEAAMADERRRLARAARNKQRIEPAPAGKVPDDVRDAILAERKRARSIIASCALMAATCKAIPDPHELAARFIADGVSFEDARDEMQRMRVEASDAIGEVSTHHRVGADEPLRVDLAANMRKRAGGGDGR